MVMKDFLIFEFFIAYFDIHDALMKLI